MTILGYTLPQLRKSVVELVFAGAALLAFFITFDPALPEAVGAVALAAIGVVAVFQASYSYADVGKAFMALVVAGVALYGFFNTGFGPDDSEKVIAIGGAIVNVAAVFFVKNDE